MRKRILSLITALTLIIPIFNTISAISAEESVTAGQIKVGDYIQMGTYNGNPIKWRCIGYGRSAHPLRWYGGAVNSLMQDKYYTMYEPYADSGDVPLFVADETLCEKAFDATITSNRIPSSHDTQQARNTSGSNLWSDSNIRDWLNSDAPEGEVVWSDGNPPDSGRVYTNTGSKSSGYAQESGFLSNFTDDERLTMTTVRQKNILGISDSDGTDFKTQYGYDRFHDSKSTLNSLSIETFPTKEYDNALYRLSMDTVFLPDIRQFDVMYKNSTSDKLGENYYKKDCMLRSPFVTTELADIYIKSFSADKDAIYGHYPCLESGIRPMFYAKAGAVAQSGDGTSGSPYILRMPIAEEQDTLSAKNIKIGDYVEMGTYYGEKITWRCIGFERIDRYEDDGTPVKYDGAPHLEDLEVENSGVWKEGYLPLMVSENILTFKPFDAKSDISKIEGTSHALGGDMRAQRGSSYWGDSNMRSWLNSAADAGKVEWLCGNPPDKDHIYEGINAYDGEAGFLNGFTENEINAIKIASKRTLLSSLDTGKADSGSSGTTYNAGTNYTGTRYYYLNAAAEYTRDKIFLPDAMQIVTLMGSDAGVQAIPTYQALAHADSNMAQSPFAFYPYWVGTAGHNGRQVYVVQYDAYGAARADTVSADTEGTTYIGVRPAFYLDTDAEFTKGNGKDIYPYSFDGNVTQIESKIQTGEYIQMGKYNGEPILWRCIGEDEHGAAMISDKIIDVKPYDASGSETTGYVYWGNRTMMSSHARYDNLSDTITQNRITAGSNFWGDSNMRSWFNSSAEAGSIKWLCKNPPDKTHVYNGINAYDNDEGFLRNFTDKELGAMYSFKYRDVNSPDWYRSLISYAEVDTPLNYNEALGYVGAPEGAIESLPEECASRSYEIIADGKVILPDASHLGLMWENRDILGDKYYMAQPTAECVENSESKPYGMSQYNYFSYWIGLPRGNTDNKMRLVNADGGIGEEYAYNGEVGGVRPLFYLSKGAAFIDGAGTADNPYIIDDFNAEHPDTSSTPIPTINPTLTPSSTPIPTITLTPTSSPAATSTPAPSPASMPIKSEVGETIKDNKHVITVNVTSVTSPDLYETASVYAAIYDKNGRLVEVQKAPLAETNELQLDRIGTSNEDEWDTCIKIFIWDDNMQPLADMLTIWR